MAQIYNLKIICFVFLATIPKLKAIQEPTMSHLISVKRYSYHSGVPRGFRSSMPGTQDKSQTNSLLSHICLGGSSAFEYPHKLLPHCLWSRLQCPELSYPTYSRFDAHSICSSLSCDSHHCLHLSASRISTSSRLHLHLSCPYIFLH